MEPQYYSVIEFAAFGSRKAPLELLNIVPAPHWHYMQSSMYTIGCATLMRKVTDEEEKIIDGLCDEFMNITYSGNVIEDEEE